MRKYRVITLSAFALLGVSFATSCGAVTSSASIGSGSNYSSTSGGSAGSSQGGSAFSTVYTVTFYAGFSSLNNLNYKDVKVASGETVKAPTVKRSNYSVDKWCLSYDAASLSGTGDAFDFATPVSKNFTLYAHWVKASAGSHSQEEIDTYMKGLAGTSVSNHLYIHYYRFGNAADSYSDWDVWCWPYKPTAGEGAKFDWVGRTQSADHLSATGEATLDDFGGAYVDIDLTKSYAGGWNADTKTMGGTQINFYQNSDPSGELDTNVGFQIVQSSTRTSAKSFWTNDGSNQFPTLSYYAMQNTDGTTSYHIFALQDKVAALSKTVINDLSDPFADDDGKNVTYGNSAYVSAIPSTSLAATSPEFLKGKAGDSASYLENGAGVGYQVMVASFADSDGDGFGDIYGVEQKLSYIKNLGVNVLWLTPIQLSDSYHGYDITDYSKVDPKFGSTKSPAALANNGVVTSDTALADYQSLIKAAHGKGMVVIMDLVLNHTSTGNSWFTKSAQLDSTYRGYYQWGNHETQSGISETNFWYPYGDHVYSYYAKFGSSMPELNYMYAPTRQAVADMANAWCDLGVDGFRMDAVKHIFLKDEAVASSGDTILSDLGSGIDYSSNVTKNLAFWKYLNGAVKAKHPNAFFVGENFDGHAYHVAPYYEGFDSLFDFYSYFNLTSLAASGLAKSTTESKVSASGFMLSSGAYSSSGDGDLSGGKSEFSYGNNSAWNVVKVFETYNKYRSGSSGTTSGSALPAIFTSNHDIARPINRIHFTATDANGISAQGNVTSGDYATYEKAANLVKIAELMMPGCTFIYYGDEIGMTGNFPTGTTSKSDYADLWYRQPMKWVQDGTAGDGHYTTSYKVTGSSTGVQYDSINGTSAVVPAEQQEGNSSSNYGVIAKFAKLKSASSTLIRGSFADAGSSLYTLKFSRTLDSDSYVVTVDFSGLSASVSHNGTVVATY
jgi:glycosidase